MRRSPLLLVSLLLPACGAEVVTATPTPTAPTPTTPTPTSFVVTPTAPPPAPAAPLAACTTARPDGAVLVLVSGADLFALYADGSLRALDVAPTATPPAILTSFVVSADGYVALSRQQRPESSRVENTYALLAPDGGVRWRRSQTVRYGGSPVRVSLGLQQLFVSPGGAVAANHTSFDTMIHASTELLTPEGESRWLEGAAAVGAADDTGRVLVESYPNSGAGLRWWTPRVGTVEALDDTGVAGANLVGAYALTLETRAGSVALVSRRGARVDRVPLPFADVRELSFVATREEGWVLLTRRGEEGVVYRVDLNTGRRDDLALQLPAGLRMVGSDGRPGLDADGALLALLRDDERGALYRSTDGLRWEQVGHHVAGTLGIEVAARAGTYVVRGHNELFGGEAWPETAATDTLYGPSLHVVRPTTGREVVVYAGDPSRSFGAPEVALTPAGRCAAWVEIGDDGATLEVADLVAGARHRVAFPRGTNGGRVVWF